MTPADIRRRADQLRLSPGYEANVAQSIEALRALADVVEAAEAAELTLRERLDLPRLRAALARVEALKP